MRKVLLTMNEDKKYITIKKLVETNGNKRSAAIKLNCSIRTINRLINVYNDSGKYGFVHGNRNRIPATAFNPLVKEQIVNLYNETYYDFNFSHFTEFLASNHNIHVSERSVLNWLAEEDIISPKAWRRTRRKLKLKLKQKLKGATKKESIDLRNKIMVLDHPDIHPRKPRAAYFGELIQMDASDHLWFGDTKAQLHAAIDDATGKIVGAYFAPQETLQGYYNVFHQILTQYGIPARFFTDKRTIFEYKKAPSINEDTFTQFAYACHQLGTEILTSSVPQAKGRVERLFQTLQSRLIPELRLAGVESIEKSPEFDQITEKKVRVKTIPALTHPWRHGSYENFALKQKHHSGANV